MIQIRSNLKGPIELSPKTGPVKFERSKNGDKPELLNEISEKEYKSLLDDSSGVFKSLLKNGDLQVIRDEEEIEDSKEDSFTYSDMEEHSSRILEAYKKGNGAELVQSSLDELKEKLLNEFGEKTGTAVESAREAMSADFKAKKEEAVKSAVSELKNGLIKKHNSEVKKGKLINW